jgi:catechol 2,3-dioxygenase-like lactoylglutathione lyase family enzyme
MNAPTVMHVSLYVRELDRTMAFYNAFFDREPEKVEPGYIKYHLDEPALVISFIQKPERVQAHFGHLGFRVDSPAALERRLAAARERGLVSRVETGTACCYAVQDKFWATDPDGHQWEVYLFHRDSAFNDPHYDLRSEEEDAQSGAPQAACC